MPIAICIQVLVALLGLAAVFQQVKSEEHFNQSLSFQHHIEKRNAGGNKHRHGDEYNDKQEFYASFTYSHGQEFKFHPGKKLSLRENKELLEYEWSQMHEQGPGVDCCPSVLEMVEPNGGKNILGAYVELYKSENYTQRFFELSCHKEVVNKPCRFMDKKMHVHSKCVQMYSYTYALVKENSTTVPGRRSNNLPTFPGSGSNNVTYTLDYISVRSGCSCVVKPLPSKKKKNHKNHRKKEGLHRHNQTRILGSRDES